MSAAERLRTIPVTLAQPNYGPYVAGSSISLIGTWMQRIGVGWLAWELSHSGAVLGLVAFADLFPTILIGPFGGVLADRLDRRRVMIACQIVAMISALLLFTLTVFEQITIPLLLGIVTLNGIVIGFNQPARLALIPSLVRHDLMPTAVAINSLIFNLARFIGPAMAGLVIVSLGIASVFLINAMSFMTFIAALMMIRPQRLPQRDKVAVRMIPAIAEGLRYTARHSGIGPLLLLHAVLAMSVRCFVELLPGFAGDVFDRGAGGLALLSSAIGIGAIAGGLWLTQRGAGDGLARTSLLAGLFTALATLGFALSPTFPVALIAVTFAGFAMVVAGVGTQTLIQTSVDDGFRGRVLSLFGLIFRSGPAIGALSMGIASEFLGLRMPLIIGAAIGVIAWLIIWRKRSSIEAALRRPTESTAPAPAVPLSSDAPPDRS